MEILPMNSLTTKSVGNGRLHVYASFAWLLLYRLSKRKDLQRCLKCKRTKTFLRWKNIKITLPWIETKNCRRRKNTKKIHQTKEHQKRHQEKECKNMPKLQECKKGRTIDLSEPSHPPCFHDLTRLEIKKIFNFMYAQETLNIVKPSDAVLASNYIFSMELILPEKKEDSEWVLCRVILPTSVLWVPSFHPV